MFLKAADVPTKRYLSFTYEVNNRETLVVKGHVSLGAAMRAYRANIKAGSAKTAHQAHGYHMIIERDRVHGVFL